MKFVLFCHSIVSDWNNGNAHFLRGIASELQSRGHSVAIYEPANGWSLRNLRAEYGSNPLDDFRKAFPNLSSTFYDPDRPDLDRAVEAADLVIVHEWNDSSLIRSLGSLRREGSFRLLLHDTHHRLIREADPSLLADYDGVLAFGRSLCRLYKEKNLSRRAWVWHEAADIRIFRPLSGMEPQGDLVWIGNWGDDERTNELEEFLINPVRRLGLRATVFGVRYPPEALSHLARAGIQYGGWVPNYRVPNVLAAFRATVHIPRRPYVEALPGIPTIRPFEALACGIPLVSAPWNDTEKIFEDGKDFLMAQNGAEMTAHLRRILSDTGLAAYLRENGMQTIVSRHTCAHRVDQLLQIAEELKREE